MNMRKYASYKQAAKRIIRLNQDPMKKQAFLGGLFGRRRKEYDDYGLPFDLAGGEGNIVDLGDEGRYISLGDGIMIPLPDNIGDDDYEEVGPKFKKESAAKRIVRLMGENRGLKKNAGFLDWLSKAWNYNFGPSQDGGQVTFYNNDPNIRRTPESRFILQEVDNPYKTGPKLAPFDRTTPTFTGGTFGDIYDEGARLDAAIRELQKGRPDYREPRRPLPKINPPKTQK